jgi:hypothetical protein
MSCKLHFKMPGTPSWIHFPGLGRIQSIWLPSMSSYLFGLSLRHHGFRYIPSRKRPKIGVLKRQFSLTSAEESVISVLSLRKCTLTFLAVLFCRICPTRLPKPCQPLALKTWCTTSLNPNRSKVSKKNVQPEKNLTAIDNAGAKIYYMRSVLHDHPLHKINKILENTKAVMTQESLLLIDEMILPEVGVNVLAASVDLTLMSAVASMELTESQWRGVIEAAGLELVKMYPYSTNQYEGVIAAQLPRI